HCASCDYRNFDKEQKSYVIDNIAFYLSKCDANNIITLHYAKSQPIKKYPKIDKKSIRSEEYSQMLFSKFVIFCQSFFYTFTNYQ
ncbi:hypothetical protein, partial [Acinetobacter soli]|uniref:hypothetical protein n=1 Tax=Acinetobacter soli TaxID=487316 RepID=UPI001C07053D